MARLATPRYCFIMTPKKLSHLWEAKQRGMALPHLLWPTVQCSDFTTPALRPMVAKDQATIAKPWASKSLRGLKVAPKTYVTVGVWSNQQGVFFFHASKDGKMWREFLLRAKYCKKEKGPNLIEVFTDMFEKYNIYAREKYLGWNSVHLEDYQCWTSISCKKLCISEASCFVAFNCSIPFQGAISFQLSREKGPFLPHNPRASGKRSACLEMKDPPKAINVRQFTGNPAEFGKIQKKTRAKRCNFSTSRKGYCTKKVDPCNQSPRTIQNLDVPPS